MLGGIAFQLGMSFLKLRQGLHLCFTYLAMIVIYSVLAIEYCVRYSHDSPVRHFGMKQADSLARGEMVHNIKIMLAGLALNTTCLFIR